MTCPRPTSAPPRDTSLFWSNINPYGTFHLDMNTRLDLELVAA